MCYEDTAVQHWITPQILLHHLKSLLLLDTDMKVPCLGDGVGKIFICEMRWEIGLLRKNWAASKQKLKACWRDPEVTTSVVSDSDLDFGLPLVLQFVCSDFYFPFIWVIFKEWGFLNIDWYKTTFHMLTPNH